MIAVTAPALRGAHRLDFGLAPFRRLLLVASCLLAGSTAGAADEFTPWDAQSAPVLALDRLDGARLDLADFRGSAVIVHFFATWCAPCVEELASLNAMSAMAHGRPAILAVNVGEVEARLRKFFRTRPVAFPVLLDRDRTAMKAWKVESLPTSFVLDRDLRPRLKTEEPLDWASPSVAAALASLPSAIPGNQQGERETQP